MNQIHYDDQSVTIITTGDNGGSSQRESIVLLIEDQAFLRSYDSAPRPLPPPSLPSASCLSFSVIMCVAGRAY
jgi:hypothetical protein